MLTFHNLIHGCGGEVLLFLLAAKDVIGPHTNAGDLAQNGPYGFPHLFTSLMCEEGFLK